MITLYCAPGDYESMRDKYFWTIWIKYNITTTDYWLHFSRTAADEILLKFSDPGYEIIFKLKAPQYITYEHVAGYLEINSI